MNTNTVNRYGSTVIELNYTRIWMGFLYLLGNSSSSQKHAWYCGFLRICWACCSATQNISDIGVVLKKSVKLCVWSQCSSVYQFIYMVSTQHCVSMVPLVLKGIGKGRVLGIHESGSSPAVLYNLRSGSSADWL